MIAQFSDQESLLKALHRLNQSASPAANGRVNLGEDGDAARPPHRTSFLQRFLELRRARRQQSARQTTDASTVARLAPVAPYLEFESSEDYAEAISSIITSQRRQQAKPWRVDSEPGMLAAKLPNQLETNF